jgi:hypothetical protein
MMKPVFVFILSIVSLNLLGQEDGQNEVVKVRSYYSKNQISNYSIVQEKFSVYKNDTSLIDAVSFNVETSVLEATDTSYTLQWLYKHIETNSNLIDHQKLMMALKNLKVIYTINKQGVFTALINRNELGHNIYFATNDVNINTTNSLYSTENTKPLFSVYEQAAIIEHNIISSILQFHTFFGDHYRLNEELVIERNTLNILQPKDYNAEVTIGLQEINNNDKSYVITSIENIDCQNIEKFHHDLIHIQSILEVFKKSTNYNSKN